MILCAHSTPRSNEHCTKHRSHNENTQKVCLLKNSQDVQSFLGFFFLIVLFGCWLAGQANSSHMDFDRKKSLLYTSSQTDSQVDASFQNQNLHTNSWWVSKQMSARKFTQVTKSFKLLLITFKALNGLAPIYITELLNRYEPMRNLRSSNRNLLAIPKSQTVTYGDRAFSVAAAKLWNSLPENIRCIDSLKNFKSAVKTYLFNFH